MIDETRKIVSEDNRMFRYVKSHSGKIVHSSIFLQENQELSDNKFAAYLKGREAQHGIIMHNLIVYNTIMDDILA